MSSAADLIIQHVRDAAADGRKLMVSGTGTKRAWFADNRFETDADMLCVTDDSGIVAYQPEELVITARAGTPLRELEQLLQQHNQMLACEPPQFFSGGSVGGMVSSGLSGPRRPWGGSVRDAVLGVELVNGRGEALTFGGQVMKNVAGFDVSRLACGAFGSLGVLLAVSLRVQPCPPRELTLQFDITLPEAISFCRGLVRQHSTVSGTWWHDGLLSVRLSGTETAVTADADRLGGSRVHNQGLWKGVRDHSIDFFRPVPLDGDHRNGKFLCRLVLPPAAPQPPAAAGTAGQDAAMEWAGGLRWLWHEQPQLLRQQVLAAGGWLWQLADNEGVTGVLEAPQRKLMQALQRAFDPNSIFVSPLLPPVDEQAAAADEN